MKKYMTIKVLEISIIRFFIRKSYFEVQYYVFEIDTCHISCIDAKHHGKDNVYAFYRHENKLILQRIKEKEANTHW